jgi:DNA-binding NtrC family response regulator
LLRVLTAGQVLRVGSTKPRSADVRVLVATHRDLKKRVQEGLFREDLYYRLAVVPIHIPALRERAEDISELCAFFCRQVATELAVSPRRISAQAIYALQRYPFPGNLRELKNLIERAYILSSNEELQPDDLLLAQTDAAARGGGNGNQALAAAAAASAGNSFDLTDLLEQTEKDLIVRTLTAAGGAQAEAARRMGLSRSALGYKLNKYGIKNSEEQ